MKRQARDSTKRTVRAPTTVDPAVLDEHEHGHRAKPISLYPLDFETAIKGLLAVKWPPTKKRKKKRASSTRTGQ